MASSIIDSSSSVSRHTVVPRPSSVDGTASQASRRTSSRSSVASTRARPRSPPDAWAATAMASERDRRARRAPRAAGPRSSRRPSGPMSTRRQREAMVVRSGGTSSASSTKMVDGGGSSTVLSSNAAPSSVIWSNPRTDHDLARPLGGRPQRRVAQRLGLLATDARALGAHGHAGRGGDRPRPGRRARGAPRRPPGSPDSTAAANPRARSRLPLPGGPTMQEGVHGRPRPPSAAGRTASGLADHVGEGVDRLLR